MYAANSGILLSKNLNEMKQDSVDSVGEEGRKKGEEIAAKVRRLHWARQTDVPTL